MAKMVRKADIKMASASGAALKSSALNGKLTKMSAKRNVISISGDIIILKACFEVAGSAQGGSRHYR